MIEIWWLELGIALQIFYAVAFSATLLILLQLLLLLFGFDGDGDADLGGDLDLDGDGHGGGGIFSLRTVSGFFAGFGWAGAAALHAGLSVVAAILVGLFAGGVLMIGILFMMRGLYGLRQSGTLDYRNAVGQFGTVYLRVPPGMEGPGQVEILVQGRLCNIRALTRSEVPLPTRSRIRVTEQLDPQTVLVEAASQAESSSASATSSN